MIIKQQQLEGREEVEESSGLHFSWVDSEVAVRVTQQLELPEDLSDDSLTGTAMSSPGN